jgi:hypothetical protein
VSNDPQPNVIPAPPAAPAPLEDYAIVIGINGYPQLRPLSAAEADATRFAEWLTSPDGGRVPERNVRLILSPAQKPSNPFDARPVQADIDRALRDFGAHQDAPIGRRLYFYFSGHGIGPTFDDIGMLMATAGLGTLEKNIGLRPYRVFFHDAALFDELVFIVDCCRDPSKSKATAGPDFGRQFAKPAGSVQDFVILAAAYGEKAFEPTTAPTHERRGLLTKALLEGLREPEAADALGRFTAGTLREYVRRRVIELAGDKQLRQEPEVPSLPTDEMVFGEIPEARVKVRLRITVPPGLPGKLVLIEGTAFEVIENRKADTITAENPWEIELPRNCRYEIRHTTSGHTELLDLRNVELTDREAKLYVFRFEPKP